MTVRDIWQLLAREGRRRKGESFPDWSVRLIKLVGPPAPPNESELASIRKAPPCHICHARVQMSDMGRLYVVHDRDLHGVGEGWAREERPRRRTGYGIRELVGAAVYGRDP
ncbi:MAG TPA: hypothetical protein VFK04_12835 [Gemmatimonadaceae bacterium]|nr:hypothetical protein [Gemmatimonadaceae bacterium]